MSIKTVSAIFIVLGIYIIIDGVGSMLIYQFQPLFFDHFMRMIRILIGVTIIIISFNVKRGCRGLQGEK